MLGIKNSFDHARCLKLARVVEVDGEKQICFRDKVIFLNSSCRNNPFQTKCAFMTKGHRNMFFLIVGSRKFV